MFTKQVPPQAVYKIKKKLDAATTAVSQKAFEVPATSAEDELERAPRKSSPL